MEIRKSAAGFHFWDQILYTKKKGVEMNKKLLDRQKLVKKVGIVTIAAILLSAWLMTVTVCAQEEPSSVRYYNLLAEIPGDLILKLAVVMNDLDEKAEEPDKFMEDPGDYLLERGVDFRAGGFQIIGINLEAAFASETKVVGVSQASEDEYTFGFSALGLFFKNVGVLIQEQLPKPKSPDEGFPPSSAPGFSASSDVSLVMTTMLSVVVRIPERTLNKLSEVMRELNGEEAASSREAFLDNPIQYLGENEVLLPSEEYRILAFDLAKASELDTQLFGVSPAEGGAYLPEGLGFVFERRGVFIKAAF